MTTFKPGDRVRNLWDSDGRCPQRRREGTVLPPPDDCELFENEIHVQLDNPETLPYVFDEPDDGKYILTIHEVEKI